MDPNTNSSLLEELIAAGFEQELAEKAVTNAPLKTFDAAIEYIEKLKNVRDQKSKRKHEDDQKNEDEMAKERERMEQYLKQREMQKMKEELLVKKLEAKIEANRSERKSDEMVNETDNIKKSEKVPDKDDCRIKVRTDSGSKVVCLNKNETVSVLFMKIEAIVGTKRFDLCDINHVQIVKEDKTLKEAGFYPTKVVLVNHK